MSCLVAKGPVVLVVYFHILAIKGKAIHLTKLNSALKFTTITTRMTTKDRQILISKIILNIVPFLSFSCYTKI